MSNKELKFRFKRNKRLTKKQLYGYSYMKWDGLRRKLSRICLGECSFCYEAGKEVEKHEPEIIKCRYCQIDKTLCNEFGIESLYSKVNQANRKLYRLVDEMCTELARGYQES